jgi:hypothetical protein
LIRLEASLAVLLLLGAGPASAAPRELGRVDWGRDLDAAFATSATEGRPVFVLFQEVPGCRTCVSFGEQVLGHPLLVEAIETEFVPVFVYNNRPGRDAEILARYAEPAWNNPVVRLLDAEGRDLIPRRAGVWEPFTVGERMIAALEAAGRPVPPYLRDAVDELRPRHTERASFGMYCYWSGEACLGALPGVLESRTGSLDGSEVVELRFDPAAVSYAELVGEARRRGCADRVFVHDAAQRAAAEAIFGDAVTLATGHLREAGSRDQKYYLRRSPWKDADLTPRQALRVNAALEAGLDPAPHLSPRQTPALRSAAPRGARPAGACGR